MANESEILRFDDVWISFSGEPALRGISFRVLAGETRILLGAAGSGKTVLLKVALGLLRPDRGRVFLFGQDITALPEAAQFELRSRVGMLFQESALFDSLTIEDNVAYPLLNQKAVQCPPEQVLPRVTEALEFVELGHTLEKFPSELSGGMRRRVGIARANVTAPPLVLYDSPTAGLDPITATTIMALVVKQRDLRNTTTMMVTHRYQDGVLLANYRWSRERGDIERMPGEAHRRDPSTQFMVLRGGVIQFQGTQEELESSPDPYVSKFVIRGAGDTENQNGFHH
ncbi:MAG: ATP-binding cassette domain-containing protein [Bryobacter sp.]|jgi:phospholipid/cholesterol/gamma-HCH transport system ATP-binding protein|nr:ATP-binding cassette domain-containing protein [Bryobacter sp.]